jgi:hypothetical protein
MSTPILLSSHLLSPSTFSIIHFVHSISIIQPFNNADSIILPMHTSALQGTGHQLKHPLIGPFPFYFLPIFIHPQLWQRPMSFTPSQLSSPSTMLPQLSVQYTPPLDIWLGINLSTRSDVHSHSSFFRSSFTRQLSQQSISVIPSQLSSPSTMLPQLSFQYTSQLDILWASNLSAQSYIHSPSTFLPFWFTVFFLDNACLSFPLNYPALQQSPLIYPSNIDRSCASYEPSTWGHSYMSSSILLSSHIHSPSTFSTIHFRHSLSIIQPFNNPPSFILPI